MNYLKKEWSNLIGMDRVSLIITVCSIIEFATITATVLAVGK